MSSPVSLLTISEGCVEVMWAWYDIVGLVTILAVTILLAVWMLRR